MLELELLVVVEHSSVAQLERDRCVLNPGMIWS